VFAADNATYFSASADKTVKAWRFASHAPVRSLAGHGNYVDGVAFSPDGQQIASCGHDGTVRIWTTATGAAVRTVNAFTQPAVSPVYCVAWSPNGQQLVAGSNSKSLKLINAADGNVLREFKAFHEKDFPKGHKDGVYTAEFTKDGQFVVSGSSDGQIKVWNMADGQVVRQFVDPNLAASPGQAQERAHRDWINQLRFSPDGTRVASVGSAGELRVWNFADGKLVHYQRVPAPLYAIAFSPDGKQLATANHNSTGYVLKLP
jgi:WD40 repeat protein